MKAREIYQNAPIVLMAIEVRYPQCEPLERQQVALLGAHFTDQLPSYSETKEVSIVVQAESSNQSVQKQVTAVFPRWTTHNKRTALTIRQDSLLIETTEYGNYARMRELLDIVLSALLDVASPVGVERIGLRYIDEIRVPIENGGDTPAWEQWVDPSLLGPAHIGDGLDLVPAINEGLSVFSSASNCALVLRYGAQRGYAVPSTPELRRPLPPPGPFFELDIGSFWQSSDEVPEFNTDILRQADVLHEPVHGVFESLITDRLREEVLRYG